jgi:hypothetical protein
MNLMERYVIFKKYYFSNPFAEEAEIYSLPDHYDAERKRTGGLLFGVNNWDYKLKDSKTPKDSLGFSFFLCGMYILIFQFIQVIPFPLYCLVYNFFHLPITQ